MGESKEKTSVPAPGDQEIVINEETQIVPGLTAKNIEKILQTVDFHAPTIHDIVSRVDQFDLLIILAFMLSSMEVQNSLHRDAFNDMRNFWNAYYPNILVKAGFANQLVGENEKVVMIVPRIFKEESKKVQ